MLLHQDEYGTVCELMALERRQLDHTGCIGLRQARDADTGEYAGQEPGDCVHRPSSACFAATTSPFGTSTPTVRFSLRSTLAASCFTSPALMLS